MLRHRMDMKSSPLAVYSRGQYLHTGSLNGAYITQVKVGLESNIRWDDKWTPKETVLRGHTSVVSAIAFSPDGKLLVTVSETVKLWDPTTRKELRVLEHDYRVRRVVFSPDGNSLACLMGASYSAIQLWQPATGKKQEVLSLPLTVTLDITFSPDGKCLVLALANSWVRMWDLATQTWSGLFNSPGIPMAFSPDRTLLASALRDNKLRIWDISTKCDIRTVEHDGHVLAIAFSPDSELLAALCVETLTVWDLATGKKLRAQANHFTIAYIAFLTDGNVLAYVLSNGEIRKWDLVTGIERRTSARPGGHGRFFASSPDGKHLARALKDYSVELLEVS